LRKEAKLQVKFLKKSEKIIPHLSSIIATTVSTIESALKLQTIRSQQLYKEFLTDQPKDDLDVKVKLEKTLLKMVKNLGIPHQCLSIACIYLNRAIK
jgi:hypothetical protein